MVLSLSIGSSFTLISVEEEVVDFFEDFFEEALLLDLDFLVVGLLLLDEDVVISSLMEEVLMMDASTTDVPSSGFGIDESAVDVGVSDVLLLSDVMI